MPTNPIALQMYTLRNNTQQDLLGTLRAVAELGYQAIELAGMGGMSAASFRKEIDVLGLRVSSAHIGLDRLEKEIDAVIEEMQTLGAEYVVCPSLPPHRRSDAASYHEMAKSLNQFGQACKNARLKFCYHNHDFELQRFGNTTGLHILLAETDPALVNSELDVYWAAFAGFDPAALLNEWAGRVPLVHLKDMAPGTRTFAEVGHGTLDIPGILAAGDAAGAQWYIVEQDRCERPALESVGMSLAYLKSLGRA